MNTIKTFFLQAGEITLGVETQWEGHSNQFEIINEKII